MHGSIIIVGGSLSGLSAALALARRGAKVTVLERAVGEPPGGAGMGVDLGLLRDAVGADPREVPPRVPVVTGNRYSTSWAALRSWLWAMAHASASITLREGVTVTAAAQRSDRAWVTDDQGASHTADLLVGADGYRSVVRSAVAPHQRDARFAGYVLWRGLVAEASLPRDTQWPDGLVRVMHSNRYRLVAYPVPGSDGSLTPGTRQISWAWYDPDRRELFSQLGCLQGDHVVATLTGDRIPASVLEKLIDLARVSWPRPWREAIATSLQARRAFATPVAEYLPERIANGRVAILGDAAHVASPMTGRGFTTALHDVVALGEAVADGITDGRGERALSEYERSRLPAARELVQSSQLWGAQYLASISRPEPI
jgi:2-polyprenyl-6-methoxyphenol hydroxylase-like FAD-dependent oxidoreductase